LSTVRPGPARQRVRWTGPPGSAILDRGDGLAAEERVLDWLRDNRLGTHLWTRRRGELVGEDEAGNRYYRWRGGDGAGERRWVVYAGRGEIEPSSVPPGWNAWLHHNLDEPPSRRPLPVKRWEQPHQPNPTGTAAAHLPPGHERRGGRRAPATGDYEPWRP
jgi:NADH:ubiquinone oxidoreductase subunit